MYLFVYGTLRFSDSLIKQGELMNEFEFIGKGKMNAVMYDIGNYPGASEDDSGNEVNGELFRMKNENSALDRLDQYENYDRLNEKYGEYIRRKTLIRMDDGKNQMAWVYWYNGDLLRRREFWKMIT